LELEIFEAVREAARRLLVLACEQLDEQAWKQGLRVVGRWARGVVTWIGAGTAETGRPARDFC
jgi:hypothetical protein